MSNYKNRYKPPSLNTARFKCLLRSRCCFITICLSKDLQPQRFSQPVCGLSNGTLYEDYPFVYCVSSLRHACRLLRGKCTDVTSSYIYLSLTRFCQVGDCINQGFPILINRTMSSENEIESLVVLSVKIAHLSRNIANPNAIHETEDRAVASRQETGRMRSRMTHIMIGSSGDHRLSSLFLNTHSW